MEKIYSHSRLSTFEQCPLRFKFKYLDKITPEFEKTIEAQLGTSVHETLEWIYKNVKKGKIPSIDEVIIYYTQNWKENYNEKVFIVKKQFTEKDYFNKGIKFLLDYYTKYHPFSDGTIECEKKVLLQLSENIKIQGFIDRLVYNSETEEYEVHDYKTANSLPSKEKIETDRQLALYSIAVKELFGQDKKIKLIWHYLAHSQKIISSRTNQQLEELKKNILELIKKIESTTEFPPKKSILCNWCEYKSICPEFNKINKQKTLDI